MATNDNNVFVVPPVLQADLTEEKIDFYRPKLGHQLLRGSIFAVRCNDIYEDCKAAFEGERGYVRQALLRAQEITFFRCIAKHPIIIMANFEAFEIKDANKRAIESAVDRTRTVRAITGARPLALNASLNIPTTELFRLTGPAEAVAEFAASATAAMHFTARESHVKGAAVGHCYLSPEEAAEVAKTVLIEKVRHIISSCETARQLTLRKADVAADHLLEIGLRLQELGALTHLRTYGTLRITMPSAVTKETVDIIKTACPEYKVFTDTPINVWGSDHPNREAHQVSEAVKMAKANTEVKLAKLGTDTPPHPALFAAVAESLGATLVEVCNTKIVNAPLAAIIAFPVSMDTSSLAADAFFIDCNGQHVAWTVTMFKTRQRNV
jgi:hypothetical protein